MRRAVVVQYQTSADSGEHNRTLIEDLLLELGARDPGGLEGRPGGGRRNDCRPDPWPVESASPLGPPRGAPDPLRACLLVLAGPHHRLP